MTQEEKELLLVDLCARLPYGVKGIVTFHISDSKDVVDDKPWVITPNLVDRFMRLQNSWYDNIPCIMPYLRPLSSMTEEEKSEFRTLRFNERIGKEFGLSQDYLNSIHIDYRGLIPMGLALEAPEGMYKTD